MSRGLSSRERAALSRFLSGGTSDQPLLTASANDRYESFPLTDLQEAYWAGRIAGLELSEFASQIYYEFDVSALDIEHFRRAWNILIERHDMLRAVLDQEGRQRVLERVPELTIPVSVLSPETCEASLERIREEMTIPVPPTDRWPLFNVRVSQMESGRSRVHLRIDVLICDAQSALTLLRELAQLTSAPDVPLPPVDVTFRDYQLWARRSVDPLRLAAAERYWLSRADSLPGGPELPIVGTPPPTRTRFCRRRGFLDPLSWARLKERAAAVRVTPAAVVLTAFAEVLGHWSRQPHFTINVTVFTRKDVHPHVHNIVGDFTSTTLVEIDGAADATFRDFTTRVQQQLWNDLEHAEWSGIRVIRELTRIRREAPRARLPVVFTSHLNETKDELPWREVYGVSQTPQVWLDHQIAEEAGGLRYQWDVIDALFPEGVIDAMFDCFGRLLARLADDAEVWRGSRVTLLDRDGAASRQVVTAATTGVLPQWNAAGDTHLAVSTPNRAMDYSEVRRRTAAVAQWVRAQGAGAEQLVAVVLEKGWEQVVAVAGVLEAGAAYVPVDPRWPEARRRLVLDAARTRAVVTGQGWETTLTWPPGIAVTAVAALGEKTDAGDSDARRPTQLAYVMYTSGSTGTPKGVMITHGAAVNTIAAVNTLYGVTHRDRVLAVSALHFDLSVYDIFGMLAAGAAVVFPSPDAATDPAHWADRMDATEVTIWNSVPALMEMLVEHLEQTQRPVPGALRLVLLSGDWIPLTLPDRIRRLWPQATVVSLGGATEGAIWSIAHDIGEVDATWTSVPYGTALPGQAVVVRDALGREAPDWVPGELWIEGAGVARGYWADPARTAERFHTGRYRTGDLGRRWPDGTIQLLGRVDEQIKLQGLRIEPGEIEARLLAHPQVTAAAVIANGARLAAFYVPAKGAPVPLASDLQRWTAASLPAHLVPAQFISIPVLPTTANGKIDRKALRLPPAVPKSATQARTEIERKVLARCREVLAMDTVGLDDNFFHAGGDSIRAIRLHALLQQDLEVKVPLRTMFEHEDLARLAAALSECVDAEGSAADEAASLRADPANRFEPFPLTDIQEAYWVGRREGFELGNVATHAYAEFETPTLDVPRLEQAIETLIARHEMLRAVFLPDASQQILRDPGRFRVPVTDLRALDADECADRLMTIRDELSHRCGDPHQWPLFELRVTRLPDTDRVHASFDLLIGDAWSVVILSRELARLLRNEREELPPIELSFRDYVLATRSGASTAALREDWIYWKQRLPELPPAPQLPMHAARGGTWKPRFVRHHDRLSPELWSALRERGVEHGLTPSALLCAAYCEVLGAWSQSPRFTVATTLFNRMPIHEHVDRIVGDFTSLTLLDVELDGESDFLAYALRMQGTLRQHLEHAQVSGIQLVRELAKSGRPPIPVVFTSTLGFAKDAGADRLWHQVFGVSQTPQVWMDHQVAEEDDGLRYQWDVVDALFPAGVVEAMFACYGRLLVRLAQDAEAWRGSRATLLDRDVPHRAEAEGPAIVRDALGRQAPDWVTGELWVNDVPAGDLGRRLPDGTIERVARVDQQIVSQEPRIVAARVEARLLAHPQVAAATVVVAGARLAAFYVPATTAPELDADKVDFRLQRHGLRHDCTLASIALPDAQANDAAFTALLQRRHSARRFQRAAVPLETLATLLSCLRSFDLPETPFAKYRYASAGGLYPVQTYVLVRRDGIDGVGAGVYYYNPAAHELSPLSSYSGEELVLDDSPAFMLFMIARMAAIEPVYHEASDRFCLIEAGEMAHALELQAAECGVGLRQMGNLPFDTVRPHLALDASDRYLHGLWGGWEDREAPRRSGERLLPELKAYLQQQLPAYQIPQLWIAIEKLPVTSKGVVNRQLLVEQALRTATPHTDRERTRLEQLIATNWAEVLGVSAVSFDLAESFFDAGGNSVLLVRLQAKLSTALNRPVALGVLLQGPTIREMATALLGEDNHGTNAPARERAHRRLEALDNLDNSG